MGYNELGGVPRHAFFRDSAEFGVHRLCFFEPRPGKFMQLVDFIGFGSAVGYLNSYLFSSLPEFELSKVVDW